MKEPFSGYGLGGFSQVVQFASLGGRTTPLQLMNVLQFGNDVEFAQAISRSPELANVSIRPEKWLEQTTGAPCSPRRAC